MIYYIQMRVNIITNAQNASGLVQDANILRGILTATFEKEVQIRNVPHVFPQCEEAEANIFLEVVNPSLFSYAKKNILIPNTEWYFKNWIPYLDMFDEIWVKTDEAGRLLKKLTKTPLRYICWTSIDKVWDPTMQKKNYHKAIVPVGKNIFRHPKPIFQAYMRIKQRDEKLYKKLPDLYVVYSSVHLTITCPEEITDKVHMKSEFMKEKEYDELFRECGLAICTSLAEGFCHAVNEAMSLGCNLLLSSIPPFMDDLVGGVQVGAFYANYSEKVEQPECLGELVDTDIESLIEQLTQYVQTPFSEKKNGSETLRSIYEHRHRLWIQTMKTTLRESIPTERYELKNVFPKEEDLPDISILTITKDRRSFMPLTKYSYMIQSYPEDKLEWVIVDDGDDPIEDTLIGVPNVKYVRCEQGLTIGQKRNLAVQNAMYDILVNMDDDDVYPNNSVLHRVAMLLKDPAKECAFCTTIPCYDICKFSSFMNVPPSTLPMSQRVSEATMIFTRKFWQENPYPENVKVAEADAFVGGREQMCRELSPQDVIVSLIHPRNMSSRKTPEIKEPNGCHYGFNETLFAMVTQIGEELVNQQVNTSCQTENDGASCHHGESS